jgi:hypothetical protein
MVEVTNELIYETSKKLQPDLADVKKYLGDHGRQLIRIRKEINHLRGDDLRKHSGPNGSPA